VRQRQRPNTPLLTVRNALVRLLAVLTAVGAGTLTALARHSGFEAALVGLGAVPVATKFFDWLIK
jgi:hypothetical protein